MKQGIYRFCLSALLYGLCTACAGQVLILPPEVIHLSVFLPPILGLMWGPAAAAGVYAGEVLAFQAPNVLLSGDIHGLQLLRFLWHSFWVFLAGFLPWLFWHRFHGAGAWEKPAFPFQTGTLAKFLLVLLATFAVTSVFRGLTATAAELEATTAWIGGNEFPRVVKYILTCFANGFLLSIFFDVVFFFYLLSRDYAFCLPKGRQHVPDDGHPLGQSHRTWSLAILFYATFPLGFAYMDLSQIYGMNHMGTWMHFVAECLAMMDAMLVLLIYLLLRYRRSIMMEIVFLVEFTVLLSSAVLGWGSSVAMGRLAEDHVNDNLGAMSVICRERLDRTFFCVRQAVNGMAQQAVSNLESYGRLAGDAAYRESYCKDMERRFNDIAMGTDGSIAYYLRLAPEVAGPRGGFSMQREDARWEGALAPFAERVPIDLSRFSPDDIKNVGWYYIPMHTRHATWIEPYVDPTSKDYVISYVAPVSVEGKLVGVIGMDIDFNFIIQELRRMSIYDYGYVYIMNRNGVVLYHRNQPQGSVFRPNPEFREMEIYLANGMWLGIATPLERVHRERNRIIMHLTAAVLAVAMLVCVGSVVLVSRAIQPLAGMTDAAKRIASGDLNVRLSYDSGNEIGILVRSIREMAAKLEGYVYRDKLTGLRNTAAYMSKGAELDERSKEEKELRYGVVLFDVNFLKKINDRYGHQAGDELIRHASRVICRVFAGSPVYRIGGDEFVAVLENGDYERREELLGLFDEQAAKETFEAAAGEMHAISVARGLAVYKPGMDFAVVAKRADVAMYNHKSAIKAKLGEEVR